MTGAPIEPGRLRVAIDPASLEFETTADCPPLDIAAAQDRALDAAAFGAAVGGRGFNIFAIGRSGVGRRSLLRAVFEAEAADAPPFDDWVYVNNFRDPHRPRAMKLPFGAALPFRDAMAELVEDVAGGVPAVFESDDYKTRRGALEAAHESEQEERMGALRDRAAAENIALVRTPMGFAFAPMQEGEIVKPETFNAWPEAERKRVQDRVEELQEALGQLLGHEFPAAERALRAKIRELDREMAEITIGLAVAETAAKFTETPAIQSYLAEVSEDLLQHFHIFLALASAAEDAPLAARLEHPMLRRYAVNVMDAALAEAGDPARAGAPIIEEPDPSFANLIGRIEHQPHEGALITDFTMIKPGALHRANGGFLILDAREVLTEPFAWDGLKRCLKTGSIRISSAVDRMSLVSTISLEPDEIPLSVKVALIGDRRLYYMLSALDPDFDSLFKVQADFEEDVDRGPEGLRLLAGLVAAIVGREGLRPFDRTGVAAVLEEASRIADDAAKLTLRAEAIADLMREADHWAGDAAAVGAAHVAEAVRRRHRRADLVRERSLESMRREIVTIATEGRVAGQINGLSVISLNETRFGRPTRITAQARMGAGRIIDIEREVKLGGPLHSKGVLILSSFLATRFGGAAPVSLSASIVFEQSYGGVDGDSASSTELYALLSALAELPIDQGLAVTGSVDQLGRVQAIGGVNEKIEGFYDLCAARGLTGSQGVLIPAANVQHLNLRADVVEAAAAGRFAIHAVDHVDEGIELLTGVPAGTRGPDGAWPADSVNGRVAARLAGFAEAMRAFMKPGRPGAEDGDRDEDAPPEAGS